MIPEGFEEDPIILVDGSWYLYRAYHALPPLMTSKKQPTGAVRGVVSMVKKILEDPRHRNVIKIATVFFKALVTIGAGLLITVAVHTVKRAK